MTKITLDDQLKASIETIRKSIRNGNLKLSPEFLYKVNEVKQQIEKSMNKDLVPIITIDDFSRLSKIDRQKIKRLIKLKT